MSYWDDEAPVKATTGKNVMEYYQMQPRRSARWRGIRLPGSWQQLWSGRWQAV